MAEINYESHLNQLQSFYLSGQTRSSQFRRQMLEKLEKLILENEEAIVQALFKDLRKPKQETIIGEMALVLEEIKVAKKNLCRWMKPQKVKGSLVLFPSRTFIHSEPLGSILVISPWNYPLQLALAPLVASIAAGNCTLIKPSEMAPATSQLITQLITKNFPSEYIQVIEGGVAETTALLNLKWDHIFFTGSTQVGAIVMQAAAKNLVPVTLELGGKSPTIVTESADLALAARRITWGKFYNAGQTCVAPDYIYVHESVATNFLSLLKEEFKSQLGTQPQSSSSYARIINAKNFQRLLRLIQKNKVHSGGQSDEKDLYIEPTLMTPVSWQDPIMQEEIFGPILPILTYTDLSEVFKKIQSQAKPLSAYLFTQSSSDKKQFVEHLSFGGGCINDVLLHLANPNAPFGGVGHSGQGAYHGHYGFSALSHRKTVVHRYRFFDLSARYAPYTTQKLNFLRRLLGF